MFRLGIFGGTFDPIHNGHLAAALNARHAASLDQVLLVVANQPWQKARHITPVLDRLAMVEAAVAGVEGLAASDIEIERGGPSYTADTLATLSRRHPGTDLYLIVGADAAEGLGTWERVAEVAKLATLIVVNRPGAPPPAPPPGWADVEVVEVPALDISSTDLRARAADGRPLDFLVPEPVIRCIRDRGLYSGRQMTGRL